MSFSAEVFWNAHKILLNFCYARLVSLRNVPKNLCLRDRFVIFGGEDWSGEGMMKFLAHLLYLMYDN